MLLGRDKTKANERKREKVERRREIDRRGVGGGETERGSIAGAEGRDDEIRSRQEDIYFNKFRY